MKWIEVTSAHMFNSTLAHEQTRTVNELIRLTRPGSALVARLWGDHVYNGVRLPVFMIDGRDESYDGFQALLRRDTDGWTVSVLANYPVPAGISRIPGVCDAVVSDHPSFRGYTFGSYRQDPTRFSTRLASDAELVAFFWELTRRGPQRFDYGEHTSLDDAAGRMFIAAITKRDELLGKNGDTARRIKDARNGQAFDIEFTVNGVALPFVETTNDIAAIREDEVRARVVAMLKDRRDEALASIYNRFERITREFEARVDAAFPEFAEPRE